MTNRTRRRLLPARPVSVFKPGVFGPLRRPANAGQVQVCVCGIQFTSYKTHRQTTHHARYIRAGRLAARLEHTTDKAAT